MSNDYILEEIEQVQMNKPHVVIVGAGASRAAFPNGDKSGKLLPLMNDFFDIVPIDSILRDAGINYEGRNFEELYSQLPQASDVKQTIDNIVYRYFSDLQIPDHPTLYDHLIISLREKDLIATFNWDPFLIQAILRSPVPQNRLPQVLFLHGNVILGYCEKDRRVGIKSGFCPNCGERFLPSRLLYPVTQKNYTADLMISLSWKKLQNYLRKAFWVTIFGYSAPKSDVEAISLLKQAWGESEQREFEQFEVIDIKSEEEIRKSWTDFIHTHHYDVHHDFYDSWIPNHPRRTGEAYINQYINAQFIDDNPLPRGIDFNALLAWFNKLLTVESKRQKPS